MAGIGEAVAGEVAGAVAGEVATSLLDKIKKHVGYLYHYHDNLNALQEAVGQLDAKMRDESLFSGETSRCVRDVSPTVVKWRSDATALREKGEKLTPRNNISRLKPWSRYSASRQASKLTPKIREKVAALDFGTSFVRPTAEGAKFNLRDYMEFESRQRIQDEVLEALRNDDVSMCSICGMGGMGKTMMAKKLVKIVEKDCLFDKVAMVTVTQTPNLEQIQKGIIESLELKIDESTMQGRANKLNHWLSNNKSLLVLDDVWQKLETENFDAMGIPLGTNLCKIFITSRNLDECRKMGSEPNIPLKDLDDEEAWKLFIRNAGQCIEEGNLQETARKIVAECKGLPIAIATIATTLKGNPPGAWNDSLTKLQNSNLSEISDMEKVYSKIQVSYDLLNNLEAQSCLRLCCLFPEDYNVPVEKLVFYGWGLELFKGVDRLKKARDRVDLIVHKLKSSFLLLDGDDDGCVKLHDIVRDFAIWISSRDENPYLVICDKKMEKWPENCQYEKCSAISIVSMKIKNHPVGLRCPNLKLLQLQFKYGSELPDGFFDGMKELRVVDLVGPSKLPPLTMQKALRTLLVQCDDGMTFRQILGEGDMNNLEIFSLYAPRREFPAQIGFMCNLRCLRFFTRGLDYMPSGALSNLGQLEELVLPPDFNEWGLQEERQSRVNASLNEIESLPLTSITICLQNCSILAENIVRRITRFRIYIGSYGSYSKLDFDTNILALRKVDVCNALSKGMICLLQKCHRLKLGRVDLKYIMSQQLGENNCYQCTHFSRLKTLKIKDMNCLKEILNGTYLSNIHQPCFTNLTEIEIKRCPKLERAFPLSVAREFTQLESMKLDECSEIEELFYDDRVDNETQTTEERTAKREADHVVKLPRLKVLHLRRMPKLRVLCNENHAIECPILAGLEIDECKDVQRLSYGSRELTLKGVRDLKNIYQWLLLEKANGILQIKELMIWKCHDMKCLADAIASPNLLKPFFSCLENLIAQNMDSLEEIWHGPYLSSIHAPCFSNLTRIGIYDCPKVKHLFPLPVATELKQLQEMGTHRCNEIEEIFNKDQVDDGNQVALVNPNNDEKSSGLCPTPTSLIQCLLPKGKQPKHLPSPQIEEENVGKVDEIKVNRIVWPRLKKIFLFDLPKIRVMCNGNHAIECSSLEKVIIIKCNNMEGLSHGSFSAPKLKLLRLDDVRHLKNIPEWLHLEHDSGIPQLKELWIARCHEMIYLVEAMTDPNPLTTLFCNLEKLRLWRMDSLEEIWNGPYLSNQHTQPCFTHLTVIVISYCPKLKHVFPLSVATELTQLQKLEMEECGEMEEIFYNDQVGNRNQRASSAELNNPIAGTASTPLIPTQQIVEENTDKVDEIEVDPAIVWPRLKQVFLHGMAKLRVMYNGDHAIECPSLEELEIINCSNMEGLSYGSFSAPKTKKLYLQGPRHLKSIPDWLHFELESGIPQLQKLQIKSCHEMIYLVNAMTNQNLLKTFFSKLEELQVEDMGSLEEIWHVPYFSNIQVQPCFSHLTTVLVSECPKLKHVFPLSVATKLTQLQQLNIQRCGEMEEIFYKDRADDINQITSSADLNIPTIETASRPQYSNHQETMEENTAKLNEKEVDDAMIGASIFPQLRFLILEDLTELRVFYDGNHAIELPSLQRMRIEGCNKIKALSNGSFKAPKLTEIQINWRRLPSREDLNTIVKKMLNIIEDEEEGDNDEDDNDEDDIDEDEEEDDNDEDDYDEDGNDEDDYDEDGNDEDDNDEDEED